MKKLVSIFVGLAVICGGFGQLAEASVAPVCERSEPVKAVLVSFLKKSCEKITESDLLTVIRLDVSRRNIVRYQANDFTGLANLEILNIRSNPAPELPEGLLVDLVKLKTLVIIGAGLAHFPDDFLSSNPDIENLHLFRIKVRSIPESVFNRLAELTHLKVIDVDRTLDESDKARLQQIFPKGGPVSLFFR